MSTNSQAANVRVVAGRGPKRIAILIVAYNASSTLRSVLDRIPQSIWERAEEVFVFDDTSHDDTFLVGLGYKEHFGKAKLTVVRHDRNCGYGGNQIRGYRYAIEKGYDIVALLHGDGQYAPEALPALIDPVEKGEADAVFGSRMLTKGGALKGGMPLYKYIGNRILTEFENAALGMALSEFHSGYRVYSMRALQQLPFEKNTSDFHFDTQIIIQMHAAGMRIKEVPIPTYYGDEICYVNGVAYARDVATAVLQYRAHELGLAHHPEYELPVRYTRKRSIHSSHSKLLRLVGSEPHRILDLGCGQGELSLELAKRGHQVTAVDSVQPELPLDNFVQWDIREGVPFDQGTQFDVIILADVLEHLDDPRALLMQAKKFLAPHGRLLVSLPNAVHWSMRLQVAMGRFDYTNRGILDRTHLRFFTRASATRLFEDVQLKVIEREGSPIPWENVVPGALSKVGDALEHCDQALGRLRPNLLAYQHIFVLAAAS